MKLNLILFFFHLQVDEFFDVYVERAKKRQFEKRRDSLAAMQVTLNDKATIQIPPWPHGLLNWILNLNRMCVVWRGLAGMDSLGCLIVIIKTN